MNYCFIINSEKKNYILYILGANKIKIKIKLYKIAIFIKKGAIYARIKNLYSNFQNSNITLIFVYLKTYYGEYS